MNLDSLTEIAMNLASISESLKNIYELQLEIYLDKKREHEKISKKCEKEEDGEKIEEEYQY